MMNCSALNKSPCHTLFEMKQETVGWFIMKHETNYKRIYNFQVSVMF